MKKVKYKEEQIIGVLREAEAGMSITQNFAASTGSAMQRTTTGRQNMAA